jgi:hypothetical protein
LQSSRLPVERSPRSVNSKPAIERKSAKATSTPPDVSYRLHSVISFFEIQSVFCYHCGFIFELRNISSLRTSMIRKHLLRCVWMSFNALIIWHFLSELKILDNALIFALHSVISSIWLETADNVSAMVISILGYIWVVSRFDRKLNSIGMNL